VVTPRHGKHGIHGFELTGVLGPLGPAGNTGYSLKLGNVASNKCCQLLASIFSQINHKDLPVGNTGIHCLELIDIVGPL
jgi:hypothetical protein